MKASAPMTAPLSLPPFSPRLRPPDSSFCLARELAGFNDDRFGPAFVRANEHRRKHWQKHRNALGGEERARDAWKMRLAWER
jgi:hypothetical protein